MGAAPSIVSSNVVGPLACSIRARFSIEGGVGKMSIWKLRLESALGMSREPIAALVEHAESNGDDDPYRTWALAVCSVRLNDVARSERYLAELISSTNKEISNAGHALRFSWLHQSKDLEALGPD